MLRLTEDAAFKRRVMQETGTHTPTMIGKWRTLIQPGGTQLLASLNHGRPQLQTFVLSKAATPKSSRRGAEAHTLKPCIQQCPEHGRQ